MTADIPRLQQLWAEAFEESPETLRVFFCSYFSPDRYHCITEKDIPVSALYWFDCALNGSKFAYIYAVATLKSHRGKGYARQLLEQTREILIQKGYAGAILVPANEGLFSFYGQAGFLPATTIAEFSCAWGDIPTPLTRISAAEYGHLRKAYLPANSVLQEGAVLDFLGTQGQFYKGDAFLLAASIEKDMLTAQELLGDATAAPGILRALNIPKGRFRTPGEGRSFAMYLPLNVHCPKPGYFGLALD